MKRAKPGWRTSGAFGARLGFILTRTMIQATKASASTRPGTTPPISSFEIEMPESEPSRTVSADGGISMSTAPIAITGPVASVGW